MHVDCHVVSIEAPRAAPLVPAIGDIILAHLSQRKMRFPQSHRQASFYVHTKKNVSKPYSPPFVKDAGKWVSHLQQALAKP